MDRHALQKAVKSLRGWRAKTRRQAAMFLTEHATDLSSSALDTTTVAQALGDALDDGDVEVRRQVVEALGSLGDRATLAVKPLRRAVDDSDEQVVQRSIWVLSRLQTAGYYEVVKLFRSPSLSVQRRAVESLWLPWVKNLRPEVIEEGLRVLCEALTHPDTEVRCNAARALEPYEEHAGRAVPLLSQITRDPSPEVRTRAALTLMSLPPSIGGTPDPAWQLLRAGGESATQDLVDALRRIVHAVGPAETLLIELLGHSDEKIQKEATYALSAKGPVVVPPLAAALKSVNSFVRARAAETLGSFPPYCPAAVAALTEALRDPEPQVRSQAASALAQYEEEAAPALSALLKACQDPDEDVRSSAGFALRKLGPHAAPAFPVFLDALNSSDAEVRRGAVSLLGQLGPAAQSAVPRLIACLQDENAPVRAEAVEALRRLAGTEESLVPHFIAALADPEERVCKEAVAALTEFGPKAHAAVLALRKVPDSDALRSEVRIARVRCNDDVSDLVRELIPELKSKDQRDAALEVLEAIGPAASAVEPLLVELFNKSVRRAANLEDADFVKSWWEFGTSKDIARALWKITGRTDKFLPVATHLLRNGNVLVRGTMADIFKDMGPAAREAVPALADAMCNVHGDYVCTSAVDALCSLGPEARAAIPQMIQALSNQFLSAHAVRVLARIGAAAVPELIQALRQPKERTREFAADALGEIGPAADAAVEDLTALLQEDSDVRWWAAYALARIRPATVPLSILVEAVRSAPSDAQEAAAVALAGLGEHAREALPALRGALEDSSRTVRAAAWHAIKHITPSEA